MYALELDSVVERLVSSSIVWPLYVPNDSEPAQHLAELIGLETDEQAIARIDELIISGFIRIGAPEPDDLNSDPRFPAGPMVRPCQLTRK